jgi:serine/threonine protein kinase
MEQIFTDNIITSLFISKKDSEYNGQKYKYLGKGGTGVVYKIIENHTNYEFAIKIIPKDLYNDNEYKIGLYLNSILNISTINFIRIHDKITLKSYVVIKMDFIPNKFTDWILVQHTDKEWLDCILQIMINLRILQQKINLFHRDMKPKNILFSTNTTSNIEYEYELNGKKYKINTQYIFYITDFAHSLSSLNDNNNNKKMNNAYNNLDNDLYELKNLPQRLKVDQMMKQYSHDELFKIASNSTYFKGYYKTEKDKIDQKLKSYPENIKKKHMLRNICYFILENDLKKIKIDSMSENIELILQSILDDDIDMVIDRLYNESLQIRS